MIQIHIDILQNLQQAIFVFDIPSSAECSIQTDQFVISNEEQHWQTRIHFNSLIIDVNKGTEVQSPILTKTISEGQIQRTFKFPFLRLPVITESKQNDLTKISCAKCQTLLKIIGENQTYKLVQQQNTNFDDINEVIYCHRFCESHQHEHKHEHQLHVPLDLHKEYLILETLDCLTIAKEFISSDLIHNNELIQCTHCSCSLGSYNVEKNLIIFNKCFLLPYAIDYLSTCFRPYEPGRYIIKVAKSNDSIFLVWILPNELFSGNLCLNTPINVTQLDFFRMRKILFAHVTSTDNKILHDWKRDFSVTTLLVNQFCLDHLSTAFQQILETFPNTFNSKETFQSVTIPC